MKKMWMRIGSVLGALIALCAPLKAENATIPYEYVYNILKTKEKLKKTYPDLDVYLVLRSLNPAVKMTDLDVTLQLRSGSRAILLDPDGEFSPPMNDAWVAEKASIAVNQPKGTMTLGYRIGSKEAGAALLSTNIPYRKVVELARSLEVGEREMAKVVPGASSSPVTGMRLVFRSIKSAQVVLQFKNRRLALKPEADGSVIVPISETFFEENPTVLASEKPFKVEAVSKTAAK